MEAGDTKRPSPLIAVVGRNEQDRESVVLGALALRRPARTFRAVF